MIVWYITIAYIIAVFLAGYFMYKYCDIDGYELNTQKQYVLFKLIASMLFIVIGLFAFHLSGNWLSIFIMPAAGFCFIGDLFLALSHEIDNKVINPHFSIGVVSFIIAQLIFSFNFLIMLDLHISWTIILPFAVLCYSIFCTKSKGYDYGGNGIICSIYGFFVGLSAALGIQLILTYPSDIISLFLGIGSVLFLISDGVLNIKLFKKDSLRLAGAGVLIFYYSAMWFYVVASAVLI